jgi:hypothetical protein
MTACFQKAESKMRAGIVMSDDADGPDFLLEVTRFVPDPLAESYSIKSEEDLESALEAYETEDTLVVALACDEGAGGAFFLFLAEERACIHLTEGPCWTAAEHTPSREAQPVSFRMDNGERLEVIVEQTVTRKQGIEALRQWYRTGERTLELDWRKV